MNTSECSRLAVVMMLALAGITGCSLPKAGDLKPSKIFSLNSSWPWKDDDKPKPEVPTRIVGMWTDTVLHKPGEKSQRGFGGRLLFYGKEDKPVLVDGALVVYAFDETGRAPTDNKPTRRYVFPADQITLHQSESPVGPSYSFWLPWDEAGGPKAEVSLICRFQPRDGAVVISEQTRHLLPGMTPILGAVASQTPPKLPEGVPSRPALPQLADQFSSPPVASGAQQANYEVAAPTLIQNGSASDPAATANPPRQMTSTSIPLPRDFEIPRGAGHLAPTRQPEIAAAGKLVAPAGIAAAQPALGVTNAQVTPQSGGLGNYQPQQRLTSPIAYRPTYGQTSNPAGVPPTLHAPVAGPFGPPTFPPTQGPLPPAQVMQQMQHQYQQQVQQQALPTNSGQLPGGPQSAQLPMQIPTSGTATVIYR